MNNNEGFYQIMVNLYDQKLKYEINYNQYYSIAMYCHLIAGPVKKCNLCLKFFCTTIYVISVRVIQNILIFTNVYIDA